MTPSKPYLMRALYEWIVDNQCTPYMLVDVRASGVMVPEGYSDEGRMVLNLAPTAIRNFVINNEAVSFEARFGGTPHQLFVPVQAVLAVYAQENGQGMFFEPEQLSEHDAGESSEQEAVTEPKPEPPKPDGRPSLRIVK